MSSSLSGTRHSRRVLARDGATPEGVRGGVRLDLWLKEQFSEVSRSTFQEMIAAGCVQVNGEQPKKRLLVVAGDEVIIDFPVEAPLVLQPEKIPLSIIYEDEWLLVVNKPAGMVVHPAPGHQTGTFLHAILGGLSSELLDSGSLRPGIVHRLDKDTSGLLIAAKERSTHEQLVRAFASRTVRKEYIAICRGVPADGLLHDWLGRDPTNRKRFTVVSAGSGKEAETRCCMVGAGGGNSAVVLLPRTGRTHQLRVQLASRGTPIIGDHLYGGGKGGQLLHALFLQFVHPKSGELLLLRAPPPDILIRALAAVGIAEGNRHLQEPLPEFFL